MTMDNDINLTEDDVVLTVKIMVQDHEAHAIIGEKEFMLKQIRGQSGASISISDGSCLDRIITITGTVEEMYEGTRLILERLSAYFSEDIDSGQDPDNVVVKLIVPASQCGSLIGKGGSKIKEIRESSGAALQVSADMLPHSTERNVHISGTIDSILDCIYEICYTLVTSPVKSNSVSYKPTNDMVEGPIVFAEGKAYTLQGTTAVPIADVSFLLKNDLLQPFFGISNNTDASIIARMLKSHAVSKDSQSSDRKQNFYKQEYRVADSCAGGVIGKNGIKITEIRQISGAGIHLSSLDENSSHEVRERMVTLEGTRESVALAKFLILASIELQKTNFDNPPNPEHYENIDTEAATSSLLTILSRPGALNVLSTYLGYQNISEFLNTFENSRY